MLFSLLSTLPIAFAQNGQNGEDDDPYAEWRREAQLALIQVVEPAAAELLPEGVRANELALRRRDLEQTLLALDRREKETAAAPAHQRAEEEAREYLAAWTGFESEPPYSILELDNLENERDAVVQRKAAIESSLAIAERSMDALLDEETAAAENLRRRNTEADRGGEDAAWRAESARIQSRQVQARKAALAAQIANLRTQLAAAETELALYDRQREVMSRNLVFTNEDLETVTLATEQRKNTLREELAELGERQRRANEEHDAAYEDRERMLAENPDITSATPEFARATARYFTAMATNEALDIMIESVEWLLQIEAYHLAAQEDRHTLFHSDDRAELATAAADIRAAISRLDAWETLAQNEIASVAALLTAVEARVAAVGEGDVRIPALNERRAILLERQAAVHRVGRAVAFQRNLLARWISEYETRDRTIRERAADRYHEFLVAYRRFLDFEIFTYQKGEGEEGQRSVSLRDLLYALLVFLIPYVILDRIARRIQRTSLTLRFIGEAQANTLRNWLMIAIALLLALVALNFLDIPLTVFAFLGGALAIGLGFGMQTLIKNFISGIIVLFERRIRVGDILDVEGTLGTVTEINTRSSVIRSPDGVEIMVPNSLFLENRVTNLTLSNRCNRRIIRVGVAYGTPPAKVIEVLRECADRHGLVLKDPEPLVLFEDFGDSSLVFAMYFWVEFNDRTNALQVASDLRIMIDKRLHELGIGIPFPQRDLHLVGGGPVTVRIDNEPPAPATP